MSYRDQIISDNLGFCLRNRKILSDWEMGFVDSLNEWEDEVTQKQFNKLQDVVQRISRDYWAV